MLFVCHPKFCISIVFSFSWELKWPQEKLKTMLMQNFWVTNKEHHGMLWQFLEWSIIVLPVLLQAGLNAGDGIRFFQIKAQEQVLLSIFHPFQTWLFRDSGFSKLVGNPRFSALSQAAGYTISLNKQHKGLLITLLINPYHLRPNLFFFTC